MGSGFHHEAIFYGTDGEYLAGLLPDLRVATTALVAVSEEKAALLRAALGADADRVRFTDMEALGRNPGCIIPAWREFLADAGPGPVLGIGEPVWPGRSAAELDECQRHESLLNLAFDGGAPWRLLCPYDVQRLSPDVVADARRTHPHTSDGPSRDYRSAPAWDDALSEPATRPAEFVFGRGELALVRRFVAAGAALTGRRGDDLVLAVNELAANTMRHGAGRERAPDRKGRGRGLLLVNHLCDLVQLRSSPAGTVVRLHMSLDRAG